MSKNKTPRIYNLRFFGTCTKCKISYECTEPFTKCFKCDSKITVNDGKMMMINREDSFKKELKDGQKRNN